ncbi:hypothetical protein BDZ97DRAFT_1758839 [Flammula alnicola]|nr:hypothetical protein BDZ97DRAFT_1758839 [Flammula alnicola]
MALARRVAHFLCLLQMVFQPRDRSDITHMLFADSDAVTVISIHAYGFTHITPTVGQPLQGRSILDRPKVCPLCQGAGYTRSNHPINGASPTLAHWHLDSSAREHFLRLKNSIYLYMRSYLQQPTPMPNVDQSRSAIALVPCPSFFSIFSLIAPQSNTRSAPRYTSPDTITRLEPRNHDLSRRWDNGMQIRTRECVVLAFVDGDFRRQSWGRGGKMSTHPGARSSSGSPASPLLCTYTTSGGRMAARAYASVNGIWHWNLLE